MALIPGFALTMESLSFWTLIFVISAELLLLGVWFIYRFMLYKYDVGLYIEKANRSVIYRSTRARFMVKDGIPIVNLLFIPHKDTPAPTLDTIMLGNKGSRFEMWLDPGANLHQVRKATHVPMMVKSKDKKLSQNVREVTLADGTKKQFVMKEVVFEPDNKSDRAFAWMMLRRNFSKHKDESPWDQYRPAVIIGTIAVVALGSLVFAGYFLSKMQQSAAMQCNLETVKALSTAMAERCFNIAQVAGVV